MTGTPEFLATAIHYGGWKWTGEFTTIDLIAATTNALNGALLARRPDHYRNFTIVGILLMALLGGLGGGITRDVLLNKIPSALTNPAYITLCLIAGIIGYRIAFAKGQLFREGLFQFMTSFSLPWYAIAITCGVPPKQFIRGEWFVSIAMLTGAVWIACDAAGLGTWASTVISFVIGFTLRMTALYRGWEEPLAKEPTGVYQHSDGRPLLGRKIKGKSVREMRDLGLTVKPTETEKS